MVWSRLILHPVYSTNDGDAQKWKVLAYFETPAPLQLRPDPGQVRCVPTFITNYIEGMSYELEII